MKINQLFNKIVDEDTLTSLLNCFGLHNLHDLKMFSKKELIVLNTVEKINDLKPRLASYYLKCKANVYLENMNVNKSITVLKQVLRLYGYGIRVIEKNYNNKKSIYYQLYKQDEKNNQFVNINTFQDIIDLT